MELFKKLGPRVILIEYRGRVAGLVTVKDALKYQFQVEAHENPKDDGAILEAQDRLWELVLKMAFWVDEKVGISRLSGRFSHTGFDSSVTVEGVSRDLAAENDDQPIQAGLDSVWNEVEMDDRRMG